MPTYASFQGRVFLGSRDANGQPINVRSPGNVATLKLSLKTDVLEHYESQSGQRSQDHRMIKQKSASVSLTIEEFTKENLALALFGNFSTMNSGRVQNQPLGDRQDLPTLGERLFLAHQRISNLQVRDSSLDPKSLLNGEDYTLDADFGAIQLLRLNDGETPPASFKPPLLASYDHGEVTNIGIFNRPPPERFLRLEGVNTAQGNARVIVEIYRVAFDPLKELDLISDNYNKFELEGSALMDSTKPVDAEFGQLGRIIQID